MMTRDTEIPNIATDTILGCIGGISNIGIGPTLIITINKLQMFV